MCIRDSHAAVPPARPGRAGAEPVPDHAALLGDHRGAGADPVSYTHLTLPTSDLV